ncbi:nuclear transport factor 2 family protein [Nonomuraea candida]|uniref:nuclear transport factor 2 family protein n=1 Tax=Nonomuraea candida TaxID=359159 RepID=UPI0005BC1552|nr:nuclear transport factor 2 family protein [Nonomuraea candida]
MTEHPYVSVINSFYDALAKGDLDVLRDLLTDDAVFHVPGRGPMAKDYTGKEEVLAYLTRLAKAASGGLRLEPEEYLAGNDRVAAVLSIHGERDGRTLNDHGLQLFRLVDGKISERSSYPYDPYSVDEFFA